jgi:hypothetical protein
MISILAIKDPNHRQTTDWPTMRRVRNPKYVTGACRPGYNM